MQGIQVSCVRSKLRPQPAASGIVAQAVEREDAPSLGTLLKGTNTHSNDQYQLFCREQKIPPHPARMPTELVEFFIRFLTDPKDLVLDPFAGSNTTGASVFLKSLSSVNILS